MPGRQLRILGAGLDPKRGIFVSVEQVGLTDPAGRVYLTNLEALGLTRSLISALQQVEQNRTIDDRVKAS